MNKITAIIKITRPINFAITFASVIVAGLICSTGEIDWGPIICAAISAAFVGSAGNIINDYFDVEIDKINRPERVLPSDQISKQAALYLYIYFTVMAIAFASLINAAAIIIAVFASVVIFLYSFRLKRIPLLGNIIVSFFTGFAFIYGGVAAGNWENGIIPALFAFFANFIREIVKDIEDMKGDAANNVITFPKRFGISKSKILIYSLTVLLILLTAVPFVFRIYKIEYFVLVMCVVNLLFVYMIKQLQSKDVDFRKISNLIKLNMIFGLTAIYIGAA
ncbi:MAG: geranylgeranylglycerol-phosphate geranylgeranyltransferase [Melioribacteraceae bacterium]|nr:geranylgeranylglycerol-phosphate geranylgeranyltransferase [Melioribacteraceae bacterium]MCF8355055.1 geranylgeranylglycerol-phosphate geranylgeranyltransferase [Melioribacteraceae bacterium]MCF8395648.1 geranylgeranylglycerol-phosphate geranylgeranyltransferase [Melioribacteraceae bacterium]MCF8420273.1 geranylgeranylglycerol-phosphate geranylgeranyltransferase [Melioribacteraceae bacterium]